MVHFRCARGSTSGVDKLLLTQNVKMRARARAQTDEETHVEFGGEKYFILLAPWSACHCARIAFPSEELSWV